MNYIDQTLRGVIFHRYQMIQYPYRFDEFIWYHVETTGSISALEEIITPIYVLEKIIKSPKEVSEDLRNFHKVYVNLLKRGETAYIRCYYDFHLAAQEVFLNGGDEDEVRTLYEFQILYFEIERSSWYK